MGGADNVLYNSTTLYHYVKRDKLLPSDAFIVLTDVYKYCKVDHRHYVFLPQAKQATEHTKQATEHTKQATEHTSRLLNTQNRLLNTQTGY